jgi:hypothetical protein
MLFLMFFNCRWINCCIVNSYFSNGRNISETDSIVLKIPYNFWALLLTVLFRHICDCSLQFQINNGFYVRNHKDFFRSFHELLQVDFKLELVFSTTLSIIACVKRVHSWIIKLLSDCPKTGISSDLRPKDLWLRWYLFFHIWSASKAPRLSIYLKLPNQQNQACRFSQCKAPNSGVIQEETSEWSMISVSDCPIPEVSRMIIFCSFDYMNCIGNIFRQLDWRVANERM